MNDLRSLRDYALDAPTTWAAVPVTADVSGWEADVAARLCDGDKVRARLAAALRRSQPEVVAELHLLAGVWVPDREAGEIVGLLAVDWILPTDGYLLTRDYYRSLIEPDPRTGLDVYGRYVDYVELPAGPALLTREIIARPASNWKPWRKVLQENVVYTVFPHGSTEALSLTFATYSLDHGDLMAVDAATTAESLRVELERA